MDTQQTDPDPFQWLEDGADAATQAWIAEQSQGAYETLAGPRYEHLRRVAAAAERNEATPSFYPAQIMVRGERVYEVCQGEEHPRGILRVSTLERFEARAPEWRTVVDLDALCATSGDDLWFPSFQLDALRFSPLGERFLLALCEGGARDVIMLREIDLADGKIVAEGFATPARKQYATWVDSDTLLVALPLVPIEETAAGYGDRVRLWRRGERLDQAPILFQGSADALLCGVARAPSVDGDHLFILESRNFSDVRLHQVLPSGTTRLLPIPTDLGWFAAMSGCLNAVGSWLILRANSAWAVGDTTFPEGALVAVDLASFDTNIEPAVALLYAPSAREAIPLHLSMTATADRLYFSVMRDVVSHLYMAHPDGDESWVIAELPVPSQGRIALPIAANAAGKRTIAIYESPAVAPVLFALGPKGLVRKKSEVSEGGLVTTAHFAEADDGTAIPYFVTSRGNSSGPRHTLAHAYGAFGTAAGLVHDIWGFGLALRAWLASGHVLVSAHPRGGGEYGPRWHRAAMGAAKSRTWRDFAAVCDKLVAEGVTSTDRFGVIGGSGAGTTAATLALKRPDLFTAAICLVPALDLLALPHLASGVKGTEEYGDATSLDVKAAMLDFSPYESVRSGVAYPSCLLVASTLDDRVHPSHARKMAAKLQSVGADALFYETPTGGHQMVTDSASRAVQAALQLRFLERAFDCPLIGDLATDVAPSADGF